MIAAEGVLPSRGDKTSHAAVVARGMGKTCVCGAEELQVDTKNRRFTAPGGVTVEEGDVISIDGSTGRVWRSEEHTSELQSRQYLVCRLLLEKKPRSDLRHLCLIILANK